jgi:LysR family glycine cleavage system transcriptional activator
VPGLNSVHLNGLRAVEAVARRGSLQKAADELGVSPSAVSQQVGRAEKQIGRPLFARARDGLVPTEFGALFAARLSAAFHELKQAVALADAAGNILVVSVAPAFASRWLVPRLSRLYARHEGFALRIDASSRLIDLNRSDVDLAIRMGDGHWPDVEAELLLPQEIFPVCAPAIGKRLMTIADLAQEYAIRDESSMFAWERWFESAGAAPVALLQGATFSDPLLCLEAAIGGQGVMLAWQLLVADCLADGRLVAPFGISARSGLGYYLVTAAERRPSANVRAFKRWIAEEIGADGDGFWFAGWGGRAGLIGIENEFREANSWGLGRFRIRRPRLSKTIAFEISCRLAKRNHNAASRVKKMPPCEQWLNNGTAID